MRCLSGWAILGVWIGALVFWSDGAWAQARTGTTARPAAQAARPGTSSGTSQKAGLKGDALIQYDAETGSLIVITDEETNKEIKKVVESLDLPVPQVLIKVLFLEVTHTDGLDFGVEALSQRTKTHDFSTQVDTETLQTIFGVATGITTGGFYRIVEKDLNATLAALAQVTKLEVLSRPSILARNNKEAVITVGQRFPIIQNSRILDTGQTVNTLSYMDVGIILRVTPHITEDGIVSMDVAPEISQPTAQTVAISDNASQPVISTRGAQTSVVVPDGRTVVIGGLMEDSKKKDTRKVPLLGDIPLLGMLFQRKIDSKSKTELLIFLTPHVVRTATELDTMSASEEDKTRLAPKVFDKDQMTRYMGGKSETSDSGTAPESVPAAEAESGVPESMSTPESEPSVTPDTGGVKRPRGGQMNRGRASRSRR